jgi:hypothetical protein
MPHRDRSMVGREGARMMTTTRTVLLGATLLGLATPRVASAQDLVLQPAQEAAEQHGEAAEQAAEQPAEGEPRQAQGERTPPAQGEQPATPPNGSPSRRHSWDAPPVYETVVTAPRLLREEEPIGDYAQPRWTAARRFPTTRVYVMPADTVEFEYWYEAKSDLSGTNPLRQRSQFEGEFGLGHRLQLDLYLTTEQLGGMGSFALKSEKAELRYALADWDVIPTNPTLYLEIVRQHDGPPMIEAKVLLGGELAPRWHWGVNLVFEHELTGSDRADEYAISAAVACTLVDQIFSLGLEVVGEMVDKAGARFAFDNWEVLAGPSIQLRPVPPMHIDLVALFGAEVEAGDDGKTTTPLAEPTVVVGWEF